jgi:hypothetical protein
LGAGLFAQTLISCSNDDKQQTFDEIIQVAPDPNASSSQQEAVSQIKRIATTVAPFLEESMDSDGRGSFGCMATNPPIYMAENEAVEIIKTELQKAGLELADSFKVEQIQAPVDDDPETDQMEVHGEFEIKIRKGVKLGGMDYVFDLGDEKRSIAIEFLSLRDYNYWDGESLSTVSSYDFPALMIKLRKIFEERKQGKPVTIGIFFEPLVYPDNDIIPPLDGLDDQQRTFVREQALLAEGDSAGFAQKQAREKLLGQVQYFIEYLRKEGVLPTE